MRFALDKVAAMMELSPAQFAAARSAFETLSVDEALLTLAHVFGDVLPTLQLLKQHRVKTYLMTRGFGCLQNSKLDVLDRLIGFRDFFDGIYIHDLSTGSSGATQYGILSDIRHQLRQDGVLANEILVIGDDPRSELAAAAQLGLRTMMISRRDTFYEDVSHEHVTTLNEIHRFWSSVAIANDAP